MIHLGSLAAAGISQFKSGICSYFLLFSFNLLNLAITRVKLLNSSVFKFKLFLF